VRAKPIRVLLVEDNPGDARLIKEMLADAEGQDFSIEWVSRLADGLEHMSRDQIDVVLLDLGLPDSQGLDTFLKARDQAPQVPFVVLTGLADENLALTALRQGAQDYLYKDETHPNLILRAIRYATERKQAEQALERERNKLYSVLNALPAFVHLKDADLSIRFANRRFTEFFGEPGNKHCYELLGGRSKPCENCSALQVLKSKTPDKGEWTDSLHGRTFEVYNYPFCSDDELLVLTLGLDITERKKAEEALRQSEEHYRSLFDNMLNGYAYCKMLFENGQPCDFIYLNVNRAFETLTGLQNVVGKRVSEVIPGIRESDPELIELFGRVALTGAPALSETFVKAMGVWFSISVYSQEKEYLVVVFDVITERKKAEEALRQSEESLRYMASQLLHAQERERLRVAHELHDDLGQSLMLLKLQLSIMSRGLPAELQNSRQECGAAIENVQEIIDSVRRLSHDLIPPTLAEVGLKSAINDLLEEFCQHQGVDCAADIDEAKGLFPPDTELILYRILQESLTNIGKYAQATRVSISLKRKDHQVFLSVEDNGLGFDLERIMARRDRKRGLGLASMEERARMLGGTFRITSALNMGTKIQVTVPLGK
jgi:PAS domain S-box-containing protein